MQTRFFVFLSIRVPNAIRRKRSHNVSHQYSVVHVGIHSSIHCKSFVLGQVIFATASSRTTALETIDTNEAWEDSEKRTNARPFRALVVSKLLSSCHSQQVRRASHTHSIGGYFKKYFGRGRHPDARRDFPQAQEEPGIALSVTSRSQKVRLLARFFSLFMTHF